MADKECEVCKIKQELIEKLMAELDKYETPKPLSINVTEKVKQKDRMG